MKQYIIKTNCTILLLFLAILTCSGSSIDSTKNHKKSPLFIPTIGYSVLMNGFGKVGTMVKITNRIYAEFNYTYFQSETYFGTSGPTRDVQRTTSHKYLFGINIFNKRHTFFQNFAYRIIYTDQHTYVNYNVKKPFDVDDKYRDPRLFSYNVGWKLQFKIFKHDLGFMPKAGIFLLGIIESQGLNRVPFYWYPFPINYELNLYYTI